MWTLEIENADHVVHNIYNLADPTGLIVYAGPDVQLALRKWHETGAPWLEIRLGDVSVYCAHIPTAL